MYTEDFAKMLETIGLFSGPTGLSQKEPALVKSIIEEMANTVDLRPYSIKGDNSLDDIRKMIKSHKTVRVTKSFAECLLDKDPEIFDGKELIIEEG